MSKVTDVEVSAFSECFLLIISFVLTFSCFAEQDSGSMSGSYLQRKLHPERQAINMEELFLLLKDDQLDKNRQELDEEFDEEETKRTLRLSDKQSEIKNGANEKLKTAQFSHKQTETKNGENEKLQTAKFSHKQTETKTDEGNEKLNASELLDKQSEIENGENEKLKNLKLSENKSEISSNGVNEKLEQPSWEEFLKSQCAIKSEEAKDKQSNSEELFDNKTNQSKQSS